MQLRKSIIFIILFLGFYSLKAQEIELYFVNIKGVITGADNGEPVPFAHIINPVEHSGTMSNTDGSFSINMLTEDTLIIRSMGYEEYHFTVKEYPPKDQYKVVLKPKRYLLNEITVNGKSNMRKRLGLPDADTLNIPIELRGEAYNEKPSLLSAFFNPISFLNYHLNEKEKEKRDVIKVIRDEKEWLQYATFFNLENIKRLTGLDGAEADKFMIYCNMNNHLPYNASQMQIEFQIMDLFFKYKKAKAMDNVTTQPKE